MLALNLLVFLFLLDPGSTAVTCTSDSSEYCFVKDQKVLAGETFQISRTSDIPVTSLVMVGTEMSVITPTIFTSYPNLTFLSLSNNGIKQINFKNFANSGKLQKLYISNNLLTRITNATFRSCTSLENLGLWGQKIKIVEVNAFQGLTNLIALTLSNNTIEFLHPLLFQSLPNLQTLSMDMNRLKTLNPNIFLKNPALGYVSFNLNQLTEISPDLFKSNPEINSVYFTQNLLISASNYGAQYVDLSFNRLKNLRITSAGTYTMHVTDNFLEAIDCTGVDLSTITRLYASNNSLINFNCIKDMKNLTELDLTRNKFARPTQDVFVNLSQLKIFALFNQTKFLKTTAKSFAPLLALQSLRVDRLVDYRNLRQLFPKIYMLSLTTRTWNCSYTEQVGKTLSRQKITMNYNNYYDRLKCNVKQVE